MRHFLPVASFQLLFFMSALACSDGSGGSPHELGSGGESSATGGTSPGAGGTDLAGSGGAATGGATSSGGSAGGQDQTGGEASTGGVTSGPSTNLIHPGILHSAQELTQLRDRVQAQEEPWFSAHQALINSEFGQLEYVPRPFDVVACGSYNKPNIGCNEMVEDGIAAYTLALHWAITGDAIAATKAREIIAAWANTYEENTESNARLVVAWAAPFFVNAAELLRHLEGGPAAAGFDNSAQDSFLSLLDKWLPYVLDDTRPENNWIQSRVEAHMAIAIYRDEPEELQAAVERWSFWLPIYIYQSSDGAAPVNPPDRTTAQTYGIWKSTSTGTTFVDGLCMETCRDLNHTDLGFRSMIYAAEGAFHQDQDLFEPNKKRLVDFMELHGSWMTGAFAVPQSVCGGVVKTTPSAPGIQPPAGGGQRAWELAYNHLHDRLGASLPQSAKMIDSQGPVSAARWVNKWETLTFAQRTF